LHRFMVVGGNPLKGNIRVSGSKNAALPIIAASLLVDDECCIREVPRLRDVEVMKDVLTHLGAGVSWDKNVMRVDARIVQGYEISEELMRKMRASNLVLGSLLGRFRQAKISYPGGCNIGSRPMNLHLKGLKALGVEINEKFGYITAEAKELKGADIHLDLPSVGATENIMMAAVLAKGTTIIRNAAKEPEIVDLQNFLNRMGARIKGAGTDNIKIEGVKRLYGNEHSIIPDRIEAGTHIIAGAITCGDLTVTNVIPEHVESLTAKLKDAGIGLEIGYDWVRVFVHEKPRAVDVKTLPYPGFPTDMQPQIMALLTLADGTSVITETVFENRYKHVMELRRMGADIRVEGQTAIVRGVSSLTGACVEATDLRAGAALVLAAMAAENGSVIDMVEHIDRGYERLENKYNAVGARIIRVHS